MPAMPAAQRTARGSKPKCACGCDQPTPKSMRMRKLSCDCGQSTIRLARSAMLTVNVTCIACGSPLVADCLYDRALTNDADAIATLEGRADRAAVRAAPKGAPAGPSKLRCGCGAVRRAHGACAKCGDTHPPRTSFMHPRAARVVGGDMPF